MRATLGRLAGAAALGYLAGMLPSADLAARAATGGTVDLRTVGSGNPGATNASAVLGKRWGYGVLAADVVKAAVACGAGRAFAGAAGGNVAGTAAVIGHCYPAWNGFRGGKGVACAGGQFLMTFPPCFPLDMALGALSLAGPRAQRAPNFVRLAAAGAVVGSLVWWRTGWSNWWAPRPTTALPLSAVVSSAVVVSRFRDSGSQPAER